MRNRDAHLSDEELVRAADGELSAARAGHLADCQSCQVRQREMENAAVEFARLYHQTADLPLPPAGAARARLLTRLAEMEAQPAGPRVWWRPWHAAAVGALALICTVGIWSRVNRPIEVPSRRLTPGAARAVDRAAVCNSALPKNQVVP